VHTSLAGICANSDDAVWLLTLLAPAAAAAAAVGDVIKLGVRPATALDCSDWSIAPETIMPEALIVPNSAVVGPSTQRTDQYYTIYAPLTSLCTGSILIQPIYWTTELPGRLVLWGLQTSTRLPCHGPDTVTDCWQKFTTADPRVRNNLPIEIQHSEWVSRV